MKNVHSHTFSGGDQNISIHNGNVTINGVPVGSSGLGSGVQGAGPAVSETRALPDWDSVSLEGPISAEIVRGPASEAIFHAQANLMPLLRAEVSGGRLRVFCDGALSTSTPIALRLSTPRLLRVELIGSGDLSAMDVDAPDFAAALTGYGNVRLAGRADAFSAQLMGSGDIKAQNLAAKRVTIQSMGSGDIATRASESIDGTSMGSGDVTVHGNPPRRNARSMGSGDIEFA